MVGDEGVTVAGQGVGGGVKFGKEHGVLGRWQGVARQFRDQIGAPGIAGNDPGDLVGRSFLQGHVKQQLSARSVGRPEAGGGVAEDVKTAKKGKIGSSHEQFAGVGAIGFEDEVVKQAGGFLRDPIGGGEQAIVSARRGHEEIGDEIGGQFHV